MINKWKIISIILAFSLLLSACTQVNIDRTEIKSSQGLEYTITPLITSTNTLTPTPSATPTATFTPTNTATITPTPTPVPTGGGFIRYEGFNLVEQQFYCGLMTADGEIIDQRLVANFGDEGKLAPPFYCPGDSNYGDTPKWSPDGLRYIYYYTKNNGESDSARELYLGDSYSTNVTKIFTFVEDFSDSSNYKIAPTMRWLDNQNLLYYDQQNQIFRILNVDTKKDSVIADYSQIEGDVHYYLRSSPDGKSLYLQYFTKSTNMFYDLIKIEDGSKINLNEIIAQDYAFINSLIYQPAWSKDSSKLAVLAMKGRTKVWIILNQNGEILSVLKPDEKTSFDFNWAFWNPDNSKLLLGCKGGASFYNLCMVNQQGTIEQILSNQSNGSPGRWSEWSQDGNYLYFLVSTGIVKYGAEMVRLNINTGDIETVAEGIYDYSGVIDMKMVEKHEFNEIKWSPDKQWMILNDSGPQEELLNNSSNSITYTTAVICDPTNQCQEMKYGPLVVIGAEWWQPPAEWNPGPFFKKIDPTKGVAVIEDEFSELDDSVWTISGDVTLTGSEYGSSIKLKSNDNTSIIEKKKSITYGNEMLFDIKYDSDFTRFECSLLNSKEDTGLYIRSDGWQRNSYINYIIDNQSSSLLNFGNTKTIPNYWYTIHMRIIGFNQIQLTIEDKLLDKEIGGFNTKIGSGFSKFNYKFRCKVWDGAIEINRYAEIEIPLVISN